MMLSEYIFSLLEKNIVVSFFSASPPYILKIQTMNESENLCQNSFTNT